MKAAGVTYRQNRIDLEKMVLTSCFGPEKYGYDWALVFPDDLIEWEPFGLKVTDKEDLPAAVLKYLPATVETLKNIAFPSFTEGRMPLHLEAIRQVKEKLGDSTAVAGRIGAPFSTLGLLFGIEPLMFSLYDKPEFIKEGMTKFSDFIIKWGQAQREAGADVLWVGDCLAGSAFVSPEIFAEFALPFADNVIKELKKTGVFLIYHACETSLPHIKLEAQLSADAINLGTGIEIREVKEQIRQKKCLMGNLDPINLVRDSAPEQIRAATAQMMEKNKTDDGYIFSTSEGITDDTAEENVIAMMETAKKYAHCH